MQNTLGYSSSQPIQVEPGSVIRVIGAYRVRNFAGQDSRTQQLRSEWQILKWSKAITIKQFADGLIETVLKRLFSPLQSEAVDWLNLTLSIPFGGSWSTSRMPLINVGGQQSGSPDGTLQIELASDQKPLHRYTLQLGGVPSSLLLKKKLSEKH